MKIILKLITAGVLTTAVSAQVKLEIIQKEVATA